MKSNFNIFAAIISSALVYFIVLGCNAVPTPDNGFTASVTPSFNPVEDIRTVEAFPTSEATKTPTFTSQPADIMPVLTSTPSPSLTSPTAAATPTKDVPCNRASPGYPRIDVEIDDDTIMFPGERFTKVWRLMNSGSCTWTPEYKAVWFFGANLGETLSITLGESVSPGDSVDIMVDMIAPNDAGTFQSNWKLQDETGETFGIGPTGSSPFWVRIIVVHTPTPTFTPSPPPTATPTATPTETPIPSPTPDIKLTGTAELEGGDRMDLDAPIVNPESGEDLEYQIDDFGGYWFSPVSDALFGVFGDSEPSYPDCMQSALSSESIQFESQSLGTYLCFQTDQGYLGWLRLDDVNLETHNVFIEFLVWEKIE